MSDQKKMETEKLSAKVKSALAAAPKTGELPDEVMEVVGGGAVLSGNQIWRMCCKKCGWISRWHNATDGNINPSDFFSCPTTMTE